jgi:hypothetical protein
MRVSSGMVLATMTSFFVIIQAIPAALSTSPDTEAAVTAGVVVSTKPPVSETTPLQARSDLIKRQNGRIVVDWQFRDVTRPKLDAENDSTTVHPENLIIMQYYDGDSGNPGTLHSPCEDSLKF